MTAPSCTPLGGMYTAGTGLASLQQRAGRGYIWAICYPLHLQTVYGQGVPVPSSPPGTAFLPGFLAGYGPQALKKEGDLSARKALRPQRKRESKALRPSPARN